MSATAKATVNAGTSVSSNSPSAGAKTTADGPKATVEATAPESAAEDLCTKSQFQLGLTCFQVLPFQGGNGGSGAWPGTAGEGVCRLVGQFRALRRLRHPRLCRLLELLVGRDHLIILASEHFSVSLASALRLRPEGGGLGPRVAAQAAKEVCEALAYLNAQGLVHGHLEAEAVLFAEGVGGGFKLTGHGLGHLVLQGRLVEFSLRPNDAYLAPELSALAATPAGATAAATGAAPVASGGAGAAQHQPLGGNGTPAANGSTTTGANSAQASVMVCCSCKPDVWSLGIILMETLYGPWRPPDISGIAGSAEAATSLSLVRLETARVLRRFATASSAGSGGGGGGGGGAGTAAGAAASAAPAVAADEAERASLSAPVAFGTGEVQPPPSPGLPLGSAFPAAAPESQIRRLEASYRSWLGGGDSAGGSSSSSSAPLPTGGQDLRDFWYACLTLQPSSRPTAGDLLSHPGLRGVPAATPTSGEGLRWTDCPALRSERLLLRPPGGASSPTSEATPLQYFRGVGVDLDDLFHWWTLAGGDAFAELASRRLLRPVPPVFRLPLCARDTGADDERGAVTPFLGSAGGTDCGGGCGTAALAEGRSAATDSAGRTATAAAAACTEKAVAAALGLDVDGVQQPLQGGLAVPSCGLWGPPASMRPRPVGVDLRRLSNAAKAVDRLGVGAARSVRPSLHNRRQHHFAYQWLRCRLFQRLLLSLPGSRREVFREAAEDIPPLLRARIWAALLGTDCESDRECWAPFYERLLASPVDLTGEEQRIAVQCPLTHELWSHPRGRLQVERLVHALLRANPSLTRMDGLGSLAAPVASLYPDNEPAGFMCLQRILHGFLWHFYAEESPMKRRQCTHLFGALLRFADPQLELHLQAIGMQPDAYASAWFPTWFAQLLPLGQLLLLWDLLLLRPPQFPLFVGVCIMHYFRISLLSLDEVSNASSFLTSCAQLIDVPVLAQASLALFQAVPASVTLPLYPRHSAGDALLSGPGSEATMVAIDPNWKEDVLHRLLEAEKGSSCDHDDQEASARELLGQRAMEQWRQCEWWRKRAASAPAPPLITVDDLLSFRKRCFVLDVRSFEQFMEGHFQASTHVREPEEGVLASIVPPEVLCMGGTPGQNLDAPGLGAAPCAGVGSENEAAENIEAAAPWLFAFDPKETATPELRVRLVVIVGGREDYGANFAVRLLSAGVRHVVCLLGGAAALKADAPSYLTAPGRD